MNWRCLFRHDWQVHQHNLRADDPGPPNIIIVIAWKQCPRCGSSKLMHILR